MESKTEWERSHNRSLDIKVGFDVINIMTSRFEREMGRQFDRVWQESLERTGDATRLLFNGIRPGEEHQKINTHIVQSRWEDGEEPNASNVLEAFLDLLEGLLTSVRRVLGPRLVQEAAGEAIRVLSMVEKYEGSGPAARVFIAKLKEAAGLGPESTASGSGPDMR